MGGGLVCDGIEVGGTVSLGLRGQWPGDLGTHLLGGVLGLAEHSGALVVLSLVGSALGVEPGGGLLPSFRRPFCTLGFVVEAGEFFGDQPHRAVCDESAHRFLGYVGGVVEATVCRVAFHRLDELRPGVSHVCGHDVEPVRLTASGHADVDARRARRLRQDGVRLVDGCALDAVGRRGVGQVRVPTHILGRQGDGAGVLAPAADLTRVDRALVFDVLDDPLLPVRHSEVAVVAAGLDEVTGSDAQPVAAGRRDRVVDLASLDTSDADALIQGSGLVVGCHRDRLTVMGVAGDVLAGVLIINVQCYEVHGSEPVEHLAGVLTVTHRQRECGVLGVSEAVQFAHVVGAAPDPGGHIEHPAPAHGGQLGAVTDERDRRARLGGDGQQGVGGVLVKHPGLVHDHPFTPRQHGFSRRAGVDAAGHWVGVAGVQASPDAIVVPPPPMRIHQRRNRGRGHAEFVVRNLRRPLRRRNHPRGSPVLGGHLDRSAEHGGLPTACCSLDDHKRIGRSDCCRRCSLPAVESGGLCRLGDLGVLRLLLRRADGELVA